MDSLGIYALYAPTALRVELSNGKYAAYTADGKPVDLRKATAVTKLIKEAMERVTRETEDKKKRARSDLLAAVGNQDVVDLLLPDTLFVVPTVVSVTAVGNGITFVGKIHDAALVASIEQVRGGQE